MASNRATGLVNVSRLRRSADWILARPINRERSGRQTQPWISPLGLNTGVTCLECEFSASCGAGPQGRGCQLQSALARLEKRLEFAARGIEPHGFQGSLDHAQVKTADDA